MGYRYFAKVTFPAAAASIPAIDAWLTTVEKDQKWYDVDRPADDGDVITISGGECSSGEIGGWNGLPQLPELLSEHQVPFDHYHSDDCAPAPESFTEYVRFPPGGGREYRKVLETDAVEGVIGRELLHLLNAGDMEALRSALASLASKCAPAAIDDIADAWTPAGD